jgi:hypothetical protein
MLRHTFNQEQLSDFVLCVVQAEFENIEQERMKTTEGQSEEEARLEKDLLLQNVRLRISEILPTFPLIEMDAIEAFFERGVFSDAPIVYHAGLAKLDCNMTKAQMDALLREAYRAENLVTAARIRNEGGTVIPMSEIDEAAKLEEAYDRTWQLHYNTIQRLRKIIPHFPDIHPEAIFDFYASELNEDTPFVCFDRK